MTGRAWLELETPGDSLEPLFETILENIPAAVADTDAP